MSLKILSVFSYDGGAMIVAPREVGGNPIFDGNWEVKVTKVVKMKVPELGTVQINPRTYSFTKTTGTENGYMVDDLLYDVTYQRFVFKRFAVEQDRTYISVLQMANVADKQSCALYMQLPGLLRCRIFQNGNLAPMRCDARYIDVSKIYTNGEYINDLIHITPITNIDDTGYLEPATFYFRTGTYYVQLQALLGFDTTIVGDGMHKTNIRCTDDNKKDTVMWLGDTPDNLVIKNLSIFNANLWQYARTNSESKDCKMELDKVHFEWTVESGTPYMFLLYQKGLSFRLTNSRVVGKNLFAGVFIQGPTNYLIENCEFSADHWQSAVHIVSSDGGVVRNCRFKNGLTGVFHGANKDYLINRAVVDNCEFENQMEESIAFDNFGNNVSHNPYLCQCAVTEATKDRIRPELPLTAGAKDASAPAMRLKIGSARAFTGDHPNEKFEKYDIWTNREKLTKLYVIFNQNAGKGYAGTFAKIERIERDSRGIIYVIVGKHSLLPMNLINPANIGASPATDSNDNYNITISSGFFFCKVQNNVVRNNPKTGISLFNAFYGGIVTGNYVQNCQNSYLYGTRVLAGGFINNGAYGNIIANNTLVDVGWGGSEDGLLVQDIYGFGNVYNNQISDNILVNTDLTVRSAIGCVVEDNNVQNGNSTIDIAEA